MYRFFCPKVVFDVIIWRNERVTCIHKSFRTFKIDEKQESTVYHLCANRFWYALRCTSEMRWFQLRFQFGIRFNWTKQSAREVLTFIVTIWQVTQKLSFKLITTKSISVPMLFHHTFSFSFSSSRSLALSLPLPLSRSLARCDRCDNSVFGGHCSHLKALV